MAEGLEPADEVAGLAGGVEMAPVPAGTKLLAGGVRVVDQVPGVGEYRAGDGDQGFGVSAAFDAPAASVTVVTVGEHATRTLRESGASLTVMPPRP